VNKIWFYFLYRSNLAHWYFLLQPEVWFSRRLVVYGAGDIGQATIRAVERYFPWIDLIAMDRRSADNPYHIGQCKVIDPEGQEAAALRIKTKVLVTSYAFGKEIRGELQANAPDWVEKVFVFPRLSVELQQRAIAHLQATAKKAVLSRRQPKRVFEGRVLAESEGWPIGFESIDTLFVEHNIGGGAQTFGRHYTTGLNTPYHKLSFMDDTFHITRYTKDDSQTLTLANIDELLRYLKNSRPSTLMLSSLFTFKPLLRLLNAFTEMADDGSHLTYFVHDYYCICPSLSLLDVKGRYCDLPEPRLCRICYRNNERIPDDVAGIDEWRSAWERLLVSCDEVVVFSNSSRLMLGRVYPELPSIVTQPHTMDYFVPTPSFSDRKQREADRQELRIGVAGAISDMKGRQQLLQLAGYLKVVLPQWRLVLFSTLPSCDAADLDNIEQLGTYTPLSLPRKVYDADVDLFFFPSQCPETFSYTVSEIIELGYPLLCFDLGAQGDKVCQYERGGVVKLDATPADIVEQLKFLAGPDGGVV